jgi:hypothetical protein
MGKAWAEAVAGVAGGLLGTVVMDRLMRSAQRLPEPLRPPALEEDPGEHMAWRAEMRAGHVLAERTHERLGRGLHWAYGVVWPTALALCLHRARVRPLSLAAGVGAALGTAVWAIGYLGWLPATHLLEARMKRRMGRQLTALGSHVAYGVVSMLPLAALEFRS